MDDLIEEVARKQGVDRELLKRLIEYERTKVHLSKRRGAKDELRQQIEKHLEDQVKEQ
jgi:hypothetical protein